MTSFQGLRLRVDAKRTNYNILSQKNCVRSYFVDTYKCIFATKSFTHMLQSLIETMGNIRQSMSILNSTCCYRLANIARVQKLYYPQQERFQTKGVNDVITLPAWSKWWYNSNGNGIDHHSLHTCEGQAQESTDCHAYLKTLYFRLTMNNKYFVLLHNCV